MAIHTIKGGDIANARGLYPAAAHFAKVAGGFLAFDYSSEFKAWKAAQTEKVTSYVGN